MHHDWWRKQAANGGVAPTQGCGIHRNAVEPGRNRGPPGLVAIDHLGSRGGSWLGVGGGICGRQASRGSCVIGGARGYAIDANLARPGHLAIAQVLQCSVELLPALRHAQIIRAWSGTQGYLPDREPVIWPSSATPGFVHGSGFAGAGFQIGPTVGEVLAEVVRDGTSTTPIAAFSISRLADAAYLRAEGGSSGSATTTYPQAGN